MFARHRKIILLTCLMLSMGAWGFVALAEGNTSILIVHALGALGAAMALRSSDRHLPAIVGFALIARSAVAIAAWYMAPQAILRYHLGTNDDALRFWEASTYSIDFAASLFEDPLFPGIAVAMHHVGEWLDAPSYLTSVQPVLAAGLAFVWFSKVVIDRLFGETAGRFAGYVLALHPAAIAYSTGMMRDMLIGAFGMCLLWATMLFVERRRHLAARGMALILIATCLAAVATLRTFSFAAYSATVAIIVVTLPRARASHLRRVIVSVFIVAAGALVVVSKFERFESVGAHALAVRLGEVDRGDFDQTGITAQVAAQDSRLLVLLAPLGMVQPFPFTGWDPPSWVGESPVLVDVLLGFGGLANQLLFGLYLFGLGKWWSSRNYAGLVLGGVLAMAVSAGSLIYLGQIRMVLVHTYPFFLAAAGYALIAQDSELAISRRGIALWVTAVVALYVAYVLLKFAQTPAVAAVFAAWAVWVGVRLVFAGVRAGRPLHPRRRAQVEAMAR